MTAPERQRQGKAYSAYHLHVCPSGLMPEERVRQVTAECGGSMEPAHLPHAGLLTRAWLRPQRLIHPHEILQASQAKPFILLLGRLYG